MSDCIFIPPIYELCRGYMYIVSVICLCVCVNFFCVCQTNSGTTAPRILKFGTNVRYDL